MNNNNNNNKAEIGPMIYIRYRDENFYISDFTRYPETTIMLDLNTIKKLLYQLEDWGFVEIKH